MAKRGRPTRRSAAAKASRGSWATRKPTVHIGQKFGDLRVVGFSSERSCGHRMVVVEDVKTRMRKLVRAANLISGRVISDGRVRKARFAEYVEGGKMHNRYDDLEDMDPELLAAARRIHHDAVDAETGKPIRHMRKTNRKMMPEAELTADIMMKMSVNEQEEYGLIDEKLRMTAKGKEIMARTTPPAQIVNIEKVEIHYHETAPTPIKDPQLQHRPFIETEEGFWAQQSFYNQFNRLPASNDELVKWHQNRRTN